MKTPEFAELIGITVSAVEKIEMGRLKLSEKLAARISEKTGASLHWLLGDDPQAATNIYGEPYTKDDYDLANYTAEVPDPLQYVPHTESDKNFLNDKINILDDVTYDQTLDYGLKLGERLTQICAAAGNCNPSKLNKVVQLIQSFIYKLEGEFYDQIPDTYWNYRKKRKVKIEFSETSSHEVHMPNMPTGGYVRDMDLPPVQ